MLRRLVARLKRKHPANAPRQISSTSATPQPEQRTAGALPPDAVCTVALTPAAAAAGAGAGAGASKAPRISTPAAPARASRSPPPPPPALADLPACAIDAIWAALDGPARRAARTAAPRLFSHCVRRVGLRPVDLPAAGELADRFPALR